MFGAVDRLLKSGTTRLHGMVLASLYLYFLLLIASFTAGAITIAVSAVGELAEAKSTSLAAILSSPELRSSAAKLGVGATAALFIVAAFRNIAHRVEAALGRVFSKRITSESSTSESVSAAERLVAATGDVMVREFQSRIQKEIDAAVERLSATSEKLIKTQLADRIDAVVGDDLISVLGEKIAKQTDEVAQLNSFKQDAFDRFVQMRNRALQYAEAARIQASYFRWIGIALSLVGLTVLGMMLYLNLRQFLSDPALMERHVDWSMSLLRHGPSYTFVVLCEFLALIMFRYQSKGLEYMRYFSNEGTNIDARQIAFMSALRYMDKAKLARIIERLEATERNFLIGKDQRTLELANNENEDRLFERVKKLMSVTQPMSSPMEESASAKGPRRRSRSA
ncbi:hypothetical protein LPW26_14620 [Rhodopseudomonas sp. HC1]|uniref:hypothetical protein n=1 Tax=Rhodopseudomonas infernalis TaxID=2897386 RepID=UPI001EE987CF|nr:hypothetical protein [Rhodopseudomonas infernalis]MCG6205882.1 hypothetical protein [Rhodopseudomonas infernalis]